MTGMLGIQETVSLPAIFSLEASLVRIVEHHRGIKDTELAVLTIAEIGQHDEISPGLILETIRSLIREGRLVGIDYHWKGNIGTFVLPAAAKTRVAVPIRFSDTRTRH